MRTLALSWIPFGVLGCFAQAPTIDGTAGTSGDPTDSGSDDGADESSDEVGGTADLCAAYPDAIVCLVFDDSAVLPSQGQKTTRNGGTLDVIDDGFESPRAMVAALDGMLEGFAMLRVDHMDDEVTQRFALRLEAGCVPPDAGVVLSSYATFVTPEVEAARVELVLLPDQRIGLRKGPMSMTPEMIVAEIPSPAVGEWAELEWQVSLDGAAIEMSISDGTHSDLGTVVTIGTVGMGRRSSVGLGSPAATTCAASFDDVVFGP